jgi:hypothetical protein
VNAPTQYAPQHPYVAFIGRTPERASDIIAVAFDGDELPLPQVTVDRLRSVLGAGLTIRVHARDDAALTRCTLAIALAVGLLPCRGTA